MSIYHKRAGEIERRIFEVQSGKGDPCFLIVVRERGLDGLHLYDLICTPALQGQIGRGRVEFSLKSPGTVQFKANIEIDLRLSHKRKCLGAERRCQYMRQKTADADHSISRESVRVETSIKGEAFKHVRVA